MANKVSLDISHDGRHTGAVLKGYLEDRGVYDANADAIVHYGYPHEKRRHNLNGNRHGTVGAGKAECMRLMNLGGARTVPYFTADDYHTQSPRYLAIAGRFPMLCRKAHGMGGQDIATVFQAEEIPWRIAAGWTWFSEYVPVETELRVWMFRGRVLDTFNKNMQRPMDYTRLGRNAGNGFAFEYTNEYPEATRQSHRAMVGLGLDFGAADLLLGKDGKMYLAEVNTAPGALKTGAQATVGRLADCITEWCNSGYPERNY